MEKNKIVKQYVPSVYRDVPEMDAIVNSAQKILEEMDVRTKERLNATFIPTSTLDNDGIAQYEKLLGIIPKASETEEFRRNRVFERWNWKPPYTVKYLRNMLDKMIGPGFIRNSEEEITGEGAYEILVEYNEYNLIIIANQPEQSWAEEVTFFINTIKPCNLTFLRRTAHIQGIKLSEEIYADIGTWNYVLGEWALGDTDEDGEILPFLTDLAEMRDWNYLMEGWPLGKDPFANLLRGDLIKMASQSSLTEDLLKKDASYIASIIQKVVLNEGLTEEVVIPRADFEVISPLETEAILIYRVNSSQTVLIQSVSIYDGEDVLLSKSIVSVPVLSQVQAKHRIYVKEAE